MLWCIGIVESTGLTHLPDLYRLTTTLCLRNGNLCYGNPKFCIFDDTDFSVECVDWSYLVKCINLGIFIMGFTRQGVDHNGVKFYTINVISPIFSKDIKLIKHINITKSTGYFNENFCRYFDMDIPCKFLKAGNCYYYVDDSNSLSELECDKFNKIVNTIKVPYIDANTNKFILGNFKSDRTRVLNYKCFNSEDWFSVIDLLDCHWYGSGVIGFSFNDSTVEINTPTSVYEFKLSNRLKIWVLKRRLISQGIFFDDNRRIWF